MKQVRKVVSLLIKTRFIGFHRWKDAPQDVAFLREWHRHIFHVHVLLRVSKLNRELEFFQVQTELNDYLQQTWEGKSFEASCEMIADAIIKALSTKGLPIKSAMVSEDDENGALVTIIEFDDPNDK